MRAMAGGSTALTNQRGLNPWRAFAPHRRKPNLRLLRHPNLAESTCGERDVNTDDGYPTICLRLREHHKTRSSVTVVVYINIGRSL